MSEGPSDFDMAAAWLRRARGDLGAFIEGFAARMQGTFPERVKVERKRDGLFSRSSHIRSITIEMETYHYVLALDKGHVAAHRTKAVRGVTLKTEAMAVPDWLAALMGDAQVLAEKTGSAHNVIHDFLMS